MKLKDFHTFPVKSSVLCLTFYSVLNYRKRLVVRNKIEFIIEVYLSTFLLLNFTQVFTEREIIKSAKLPVCLANRNVNPE